MNGVNCFANCCYQKYAATDPNNLLKYGFIFIIYLLQNFNYNHYKNIKHCDWKYYKINYSS